MCILCGSINILSSWLFSSRQLALSLDLLHCALIRFFYHFPGPSGNKGHGVAQNILTISCSDLHFFGWDIRAFWLFTLLLYYLHIGNKTLTNTVSLNSKILWGLDIFVSLAPRTEPDFQKVPCVSLVAGAEPPLG